MILGEKTVCKTPEEFKAWSQNLGHEHVATTFTSYGSVPSHRQAEIFETLRAVHAPWPRSEASGFDAVTIAKVVAALTRNPL